MSAGEYQLLMERSKEAGLSANAWLMRQLTENRPIVYREGVLPDFLRLVNRCGREINAIARTFNSVYDIIILYYVAYAAEWMAK